MRRALLVLSTIAVVATVLPACVPANPNQLPVDHVVVLMQENRSADSYLGQLHAQGQPDYEAEPTTGNPDPTNPTGPAIVPFHKTTYCEVADLDHSWNGAHAEYDNGAMDGFTAANAIAADPTGSRTMGYYDQTDLPFYYDVYSTFATGDRYFSSTLTQTFPNRMYLYAGTSFGHIRNDFPPAGGYVQPTVFEQLDKHFVTWRIYASQYPLSYGSLLFKYVKDHAAQHVFPMSQYYADAAAGHLPNVSFVDPELIDTPNVENDEHPVSNVQLGQKFVSDVTNALMQSPNWSSSAMFLTYDENGGFYDHVPPPSAVAPDAIAPMLQSGDTPGAFDRYGFRVPMAVISPYSKAQHVSHTTYDHTSILKFIEYRFGLSALTQRDANADPMLDMFDFAHPAFTTPPTLATAVVDPAQLAACPAG
jgi:phospholipase C